MIFEFIGTSSRRALAKWPKGRLRMELRMLGHDFMKLEDMSQHALADLYWKELNK